jgi:hypothetical protein
MTCSRCIYMVITILYGNVLFSQNDFYLRPCIETYVGKMPKQKVVIPIEYQYNGNYAMWSNSCELGLMGGYQFNQKRTCIEFGIHTYKMSSEWMLSFKEYIPATNSYQERIINKRQDSRATRIPLLFSTQVACWDSLKINKSKSFSLHLNFLLGLSIYHRGYSTVIIDKPDTFLISPTRAIKVNYYGYVSRSRYTARMIRYFLMPQLGFSIELRKNDKEWGRFSCYGLLNSSQSSQHVSPHVINMTTNEQVFYPYSARSMSKILIFELSKKIVL